MAATIKKIGENSNSGKSSSTKAAPLREHAGLQCTSRLCLCWGSILKSSNMISTAFLISGKLGLSHDALMLKDDIGEAAAGPGAADAMATAMSRIGSHGSSDINEFNVLKVTYDTIPRSLRDLMFGVKCTEKCINDSNRNISIRYFKGSNSLGIYHSPAFTRNFQSAEEHIEVLRHPSELHTPYTTLMPPEEMNVVGQLISSQLWQHHTYSPLPSRPSIMRTSFIKRNGEVCTGLAKTTFLHAEPLESWSYIEFILSDYDDVTSGKKITKKSKKRRKVGQSSGVEKGGGIEKSQVKDEPVNLAFAIEEGDPNLENEIAGLFFQLN